MVQISKLQELLEKGVFTQLEYENLVQEKLQKAERKCMKIEDVNVQKLEIVKMLQLAQCVELSDSKSLRKYQIQAILDIERAVEAGNTAVVVHLPTGAGKTIIASAIVKAAFQKDYRVLFIVNRNELVQQTGNAFGEMGLEREIGYIKSGFKENRVRGIQIASIQTLSKRTLPKADIVLLDEAHHCTSKSYEKVLQNYQNAIKIGLTATPFRTKWSESLRMVFQKLLPGPTLGDLIDANVLVPPIIFDSISVKLAANKNAKVIVSSWRKHCTGRRTIAFCVDREHAQVIAKAFVDEDIRCSVIDGTTSREHRTILYEKLRNKELHILASIDVLSEGFDEPSVDALLMLRPTKSKTLYIQQIGRGLRSFSDKIDCIVLDHAGNTRLHGLVTNSPKVTDFENVYKPGESMKEAPVKVCPCGLVMHAAVQTCPKCARKFTKKTMQEDDNSVDELIQLSQSLSLQKSRKPQKLSFIRQSVSPDELFKQFCNKCNIPMFHSTDACYDKRDAAFLYKVNKYVRSGQPISKREIDILHRIFEKSENLKQNSAATADATE